MHQRQGTRTGAAVLAALLALVAAACGDGPSGPGSNIARVVITPPDPTVEVGQTLQLSASVQTASGTPVQNATVTWRSETESVGTVNTTGRVAGITAGTTRIIATAGSRADTVTLTVTVPSPVSITSIEPATIQPGGTITITGEGFSTVPGQNTVTIGGVQAQVTAATATTLTVTVPAGICAGGSSISVRVTVAGMIGERSHPWQGVAPLQVAGGTQLRLDPAATYCLNLSGTQGAAYLLGVQSVSEVPTQLTSAVVRGLSASGSPAPTAAAQAASPPSLAADMPLLSTRLEQLRARHREAELQLRRAERPFLTARRAVRRTASDIAQMTADAAVPGNAQVGDTVDVRYPRTPQFCNQFVPIRAIVRKVGTRGIWVEDVNNPPGGFTAANYDDLSNQFDGLIYATNADYFGEPTDFDGNGRIIILLSREVNKDNVFGRVFSSDFFPETCASANGGEIFYGIAPDPDSAIGAPFRMPVQTALTEMPTIIAHELAHVIQFGRRLITPGAETWQTLWELEGQATFAEEVVGHAVLGNQPYQNYGFGVGWATNGSPQAQWYRDPFVDLALYFGFQDQQSKVPGAPEQCGWLDRPENGNLGPCLGSRSLYGVSWSFLRWLSDHYGPQFPGGEKGLHRAMVQSNDAGFDTMQRLTGEPRDALLARWAAALYVDDRVPGANPLLTFRSWNLLDIFNGLIEPARLRPYERSLTAFTDNVQVRAGSTAYFRITANGSGSIAVTGPDGAALPAHMRVWVVRLQ